MCKERLKLRSFSPKLPIAYYVISVGSGLNLEAFTDGVGSPPSSATPPTLSAREEPVRPGIWRAALACLVATQAERRLTTPASLLAQT